MAKLPWYMKADANGSQIKLHWLFVLVVYAMFYGIKTYYFVKIFIRRLFVKRKNHIDMNEFTNINQ